MFSKKNILLSNFLLVSFYITQLNAQNFCVPEGTAYYTFEQVYNDRSWKNDASSGNETVRNTTNKPTFSTDKVHGNYSADFDGTSQYLRYSTTSTAFLQQASTNFSVMFWFKPDKVSGIQTLLDWGGTNGVCIRLNDDLLEVRAGNSPTYFNITSTTIFSTSSWYHILVTNEGSASNPRFKLYVNGTLEVTANGPSSISATSNQGGFGATLDINVFGSDFSGGQGEFFDGKLDEVWFAYGADISGNVLNSTSLSDYLTCVSSYNSQTYSCSGNGIIVQGNPYTDLKYFSFVTKTFVPIKTNYTATFNGAGYNIKDNFLYATRYPNGVMEDEANKTGDFLKINKNGTLMDLGILLNTSNATYPAGCFDTSGNYYFSDYDSLFMVNTKVLPYSTIKIGNVTSTYEVPDITFDPNSNTLRGVEANSLRVVTYTIPPLPFTQSIKTPSNGTFPSAAGGAWSDVYGNFYFLRNAGGIYLYDTISNIRTKIANTSTVTTADGCSCPTPTVDPMIEKTQLLIGNSYDGHINIEGPDTFTYINLKITNLSDVYIPDLKITDFIKAPFTIDSIWVYNFNETALFCDYKTSNDLTYGPNYLLGSCTNPYTENEVIITSINIPNNISPLNVPPYYTFNNNYKHKFSANFHIGMSPGDSATLNFRIKLKINGDVNLMSFHENTAIIDRIFGIDIDNGDPTTTSDNSTLVFTGDNPINNESRILMALPIELIDFQ